MVPSGSRIMLPVFGQGVDWNEIHHTASADFRGVARRRDGLEPKPARGWSPAGSGRLERKEVIACVVRTRGGSPNGSRRVARRAAACS